MAVFGVIDHVAAQRLFQRADEVPVGVGAVAGADQCHGHFGVGEQGVVTGWLVFGRHGVALLQRFLRRHQVFEQRVQRQEQTQVALVRDFFRRLGDEVLRFAAQRVLVGNGPGQAVGGDFGAFRGPVGVGAQEHLLAVVLGRLQGAEQVRGRDPVGGQALWKSW